MEHVLHLYHHAQAHRYQHHADGALKHHEHTSEHHLAAEAEVALHHIYGLDAQYQQGRHEGREQRHQHQSGQCNQQRHRICGKYDTGVKPLIEERTEGKSHQTAQQEAETSEEERLDNKAAQHTHAGFSHQTAGSHLTGTTASLGHCEVDIVEQCRQKQHQSHSHQGEHPAAIALAQHPIIPFDRRKIDFAYRHKRCSPQE